MLRRTMITFACAVCVTAVSAQQRYEAVVRHNAWNMGGGVAGLRCDSLSASYAELYALKEGGRFAPSYVSDDAWTFGAMMKSVYHLKKVSFFGGFGFDYFTGRNMCGSMFSEPNYYPVDILEFTPGRKIRETYSFDGGISAEVGHGVLLGVDLDFAAESYSKRKDLRHKNKVLALEVMPSLTYRFSRGAAGLSYIFAKNGETVEANEYGISTETYDAFFDKGICFGELNLWTGSGIHLDESGITGFPVREMTHGAMLQAEWHGVYIDAAYRRRSGSTGEKLTVWYEFDADVVSAHIGADIRGEWFIRAGFECIGQTNNEVVLGTVTDNGVTVDRKFGSNRIFSRNSVSASLEGEYYSQRWEIVFGARYRSLDRLSTLVYPSYREHSMFFGEAYADAKAAFGAFEVSLSLCGGAGDARSGEGSVNGGVPSGEYPTSLSDYLAAETEWYTAARIGCGAGVRWNIRKFYVDLRGDFMHSFDADALGRHRWAARLSARYRF